MKRNGAGQEISDFVILHFDFPHFRWYLFALFLYPMIMLLSMAVVVLLGGKFPPVSEKLSSLIPIFLFLTASWLFSANDISHYGIVPLALLTAMGVILAILILMFARQDFKISHAAIPRSIL